MKVCLGNVKGILESQVYNTFNSKFQMLYTCERAVLAVSLLSSYIHDYWHLVSVACISSVVHWQVSALLYHSAFYTWKQGNRHEYKGEHCSLMSLCICEHCVCACLMCCVDVCTCEYMCEQGAYIHECAWVCVTIGMYAGVYGLCG